MLALSPALVLYTGANWDLLAILPGVAALVLYRRGHDLSPTLLLTMSVWLKFFAIFWLPLVLIQRARQRRWQACARILGLFVVLSVAINLPFALYNRDEWGRFFTFNRERDIEVNVWTIIRDYHLPVDTVNNLTALGIVLAIVALGAFQWRRQADYTIEAAAILTTWFFFLNKVYSPQYFLWLVPFLALLSAPLWLFVALSFIDVIYYVASFQILHFGCPGCDSAVQTISNWDFDHILEPAMELRELLFLVMIAWLVLCRLRASTERSDPVGSQDQDRERYIHPVR